MESVDGIFNLAGTSALVAAAMVIGRVAYRSLMDRMDELSKERDYWRDRALRDDEA